MGVLALLPLVFLIVELIRDWVREMRKPTAVRREQRRRREERRERERSRRKLDPSHPQFEGYEEMAKEANRILYP